MTLVPKLFDHGDVGAEIFDREPPLDDLFACYFQGESIEWVLVGGLDRRGLLIDFYGERGDAGSNIHMMSCVRAALRPPIVRAIIIAHNHPACPALPSQEDIATTRRIAALCRLANARLIDHLIYAPQGTISLRTLGHLH